MQTAVGRWLLLTAATEGEGLDATRTRADRASAAADAKVNPQGIAPGGFQGLGEFLLFVAFLCKSLPL
jgi:hypothetical protein